MFLMCDVQVRTSLCRCIRRMRLAKAPEPLVLPCPLVGISAALSAHAVVTLVLPPTGRLIRWEMLERKNPGGSPDYNGWVRCVAWHAVLAMLLTWKLLAGALPSARIPHPCVQKPRPLPHL